MTTYNASLATTDKEILSRLPPSSFREAQALKEEVIWRSLESKSVGYAINEWLDTLTPITARNYRSGMNVLAKGNLIRKNESLQLFSQENHDKVLDLIKTMPSIKASSSDEARECTNQARAACYIAFTRFLSRRTQGMIRRATPSREGTDKTFYRVREKVQTKAMSRSEWSLFLEELSLLNKRDALIAKITLQGGKRIGEVLSLEVDQIDFDKCEISFTQSKTKGYEKETVITYPQAVMNELRLYICDRRGLVFVTCNGKKLARNQVANTFEEAGKRSKIPFTITPHVLRASTVTYLKALGFGDSDILKVTGHSSSAMLNAYDKTERAQNASKKVNLV